MLLLHCSYLCICMANKPRRRANRCSSLQTCSRLWVGLIYLSVVKRSARECLLIARRLRLQSVSEQAVLTSEMYA